METYTRPARRLPYQGQQNFACAASQNSEQWENTVTKRASQPIITPKKEDERCIHYDAYENKTHLDIQDSP